MIKVKQFFRRVLVFLKLHKYSSLIILVALVVFGIILVDSLRGTKTFETPKISIEKKEKKIEKVRAPLSGIMVDKELADRRPIAVVIDNHPDARPQSGLSKASLVYDTYAEGGITRMLAVFQENDVDEIGPIRSARVEFVNWAKELEAVFAHVGGSEAALSLIPSIGVLDFNQFNNGNAFERDNSRFAPHNVYSSTKKISDGGLGHGYSKAKAIKGFAFKNDAKEEERALSQEINITFSGGSFSVKYVYDKEKNDFKRFLGGSPFIEKINGKQVVAKNVIVQYTSVVDRAGLDTQVEAVGTGKIEYYLDGKKFEGTWEKSSASSRTKYLDLDGKDIVLNAGTTWIEVERQ